MNNVRLGIIGLGNMGTGHAKAHMPKITGAELTAVCDIVPAKMDPYEGVSKFESSAALIRSGLVDAVLIATPHYFHTTIGIDALQNGLHVLTEKPISVHKADCERLIRAYENVKQSGKSPVFAAMFNQRTDPYYQAIRNLVQSGELGEIRRTNWIITNWFRTAAYYASGGWRATWGGEGGGVLLNQCPHNLDLFQWLFGMPVRVRALCGFGKYHDIEVEDDVTAIYEYANGGTGVFVTTTGETPGTNRLEVVGDRGKLVYENDTIIFNRTTVPVQEFCDTTKEVWSDAPNWRCEIPAKGHGGQHIEVLQNFIDAIRENKALIAPAPEGIHSVVLANAMIWSGLQGGKPIDIPFDGVAYEAKLQELIANSKGKSFVDEKLVAVTTG